MRYVAIFIWLMVVAAVLGVGNEAVAQTPAQAMQKRFNEAMPGTTIEFAAGKFDNATPLILTRSGTEAAPITIRAKERGKAIIAGSAGFELRGASNVIIEGFVFVHDSRAPAIRLIDCTNVRITRCAFKLDPGLVPRQNWIHITGGKSGQNRIDHNLFEELATAGAYIAIDGSESEPYQISKGDRIDYNHFRNIVKRTAGGARAIRLGWTRLAPSQGQTVIEYNLFEACNGDEEMITIRSSGQMVRYNTFLNCAGYLGLRVGGGNMIEGNFFFNDNKDGVGGIRVFGDEAKVFNNYFEGMTQPALVLSNGTPAQNKQVDAPRPAATKAAIVFNTWVNCGGGAIEIGNTFSGSHTEPPTGCVIANNVAIGFGDELIRMRSKGEGVTWATNIMFHAGAKEKVGIDVPDNQINVVFPKLRNQGGIWRLGPTSPAIDYAEGDFDFVATDIDGQPRPKRKDAGSDEFATGPTKQRPFAAVDVGVEAP